MVLFICFVCLFASFMSVVRRGSARFYLGTDQRQRIQVTSWPQSSKPGSQNTLFLSLSWWSQLLVRKQQKVGRQTDFLKKRGCPSPLLLLWLCCRHRSKAVLSLQVWRVKIDRLRVMKAFLLSRVPRWHKASYSVKESSLIWVSSYKITNGVMVLEICSYLIRIAW